MSLAATRSVSIPQLRRKGPFIGRSEHGWKEAHSGTIFVGSLWGRGCMLALAKGESMLRVWWGGEEPETEAWWSDLTSLLFRWRLCKSFQKLT